MEDRVTKVYVKSDVKKKGIRKDNLFLYLFQFQSGV